MWPTRNAQVSQIIDGLKSFSRDDTTLKGVPDEASLSALAMQIVASIRRLDYTKIQLSRDVAPERADPNNPLFDADRAAILHARNGNYDEAIWIIFLSIHFGKHGRHGWRMLKGIYSGLGEGTWTWNKVSSQPKAFEQWMTQNHKRIGGAFGNHRKYETLNPKSRASTTKVILSFVGSCAPSPSSYFSTLAKTVGNDPNKIFDSAYRSLPIERFGRLAKFDFLCMLGRLSLAPLEPGSTYLSGATGPLRGARLLVDGNSDSKSKAKMLEAILQRLGLKLGVGMQVMEDSICNWQKSPKRFIHFKG